MKRTKLCAVGSLLLLSAYTALSGQDPFIGLNDPLPSADNDTLRFAGWTDEQYKWYEDSVLAVLYPPVIAQKSGSPSMPGKKAEARLEGISPYSNSYVPNTVPLDKGKTVGQIAIQSGTLPGGAKTYDVPIEIYPGVKGFNPAISLSYNSQQGNGVAGMGWTVSGISMISRCGRSVYYDGDSRGALLLGGEFVLDGMRLIKQTETTNEILYETEQGNIKVKAHVLKLSSPNTYFASYFEVFYPDGTKGIFGYPSNSGTLWMSLYYPLTSLSDPKGNQINYTYTDTDNHYRISGISYNGASVEFEYQLSRPDPLLSYSAGRMVSQSYLLKKVISKFGASVLGTYNLSYTTENFRSFLMQIDYTAGSSSFNPLHFYYGTGSVADAYTLSDTQLLEWYKSDDPSMIKVAKGKFDYNSGADGLISLPNKNPYWKHYRHSTAFRHSQNRFDNFYNEKDEKIFLYAGLKDSWASPMPNLTTGTGFVDILCADIEGQQEEYVIKVNNWVLNNQDNLTFNVYRSNLFSGLTKLYTRTYTFPTVYTDADGGKSIQPKFYYTGDFNGDGKIEVLAVSCHQPFGDTGKPSKCYLFDLAGNRIIYQGNVFNYNVEFVGVQQTDPKAAENNTDKVFVMDYDGDGKSDICHVNEEGVNIYTFDVSGSTVSPRKVNTDTGLKKPDLANRDLMIGEMNGDGLMDLVVSPQSGVSDFNWSVYNSKGTGTFDKFTFSGTNRSGADNSGFIMQDVNSDGMTDLLKYDTNGFSTFRAKNNNVSSSSCYRGYPSTKSILVPTNINSHSVFTQLISLKDGIVTKYSFSKNESKEVLATGMANSLGIVEKNDYRMINEEGISYGVYTKGSGAVFPYVNIQEPLPVLVSSEIMMNGNRVDWNNYSYTNAVIHRQGLGFRGFETVTTRDRQGRDLVQTYEPYRYGVLKSEVMPEFRKTYNFAVEVQTNKIVKIRLTSKTEEDKLKNSSVNTSYVYDTYGFPTRETAAYTGNINISKTTAYAANPAVGDGYYLGFPTDETTTVTRNGTSYTERIYIPSYSQGLPLVKTSYINGNQVKNQTFVYDTKGNRTSESVQLYTSPNTLTTSYIYDSNGRLIKTTNPLGLTNEYTYDAAGRFATKKDHLGASTGYTYDAFGREISVTLPDGSIRSTVYRWSHEGINDLYYIASRSTGKPIVETVYDALTREVRKCETRFNGTVINTDKQYDLYGNLEKESLPFPGSTPSMWNTYSYDSYNRILSCTEASGKATTYSYSGNSVTTVSDKVSVTRTFDAQGNLISVSDPAGTITYTLHADGQPSSIVAPGNVTTTFGFDVYRRRISLTDPSRGTTSYEYDNAGHVIKETNANGSAQQYAYDMYNRLIRTTTPELVTTYTHDAKDQLTGVSSDNGTSKSFSYDAYGRLSVWKENVVDNKWLQKEFTYYYGNVYSIVYTSQSGVLATENYTYSNGYLTDMKLDGQPTVFKLTGENAFGQPTAFTTGNITRTYSYTPYGLPTGRSAGGSSGAYQNFSYTFDNSTLNLSSRKDNSRNLTESFGYDNLNRLTSYAGKTAAYDVKGNMTQKSDAGSFEYANTQKPYAVSGATLSGSAIPVRTQEITYNSFQRPVTISENSAVASFVYNGENERVKMALTQNGSPQLTRYYLGDCYELDQTATSTKEKLYLFGGYYDATAVYVKDKSGSKLHHILRDYQGSITHVVGSDGTLTQELSYDAWGRLRNPQTQAAYNPGQEPELFLGRGYTGHEHLPWFGLINMNARLYDPAVGRFLSPDPFVQTPDYSQNFNRYSYCLNNPLKYTDQDGEIFFSFLAGFFRGLFTGKNPFKTGAQSAFNEIKIWGGLFISDSRKNFWGQAWEIISRSTWQLPQTLIGNTYSRISNIAGQVDEVDYWGGATVVSGKNWGQAAVSMGSYIVGNRSLKADPNNRLFQHEYGHYLQSQSMGWAYLSRVGIPSLIDTFGDSSHGSHPVEQNANYRAFMYFNKNVKGFYKSEADMEKSYGWDFDYNWLDPNKTGESGLYWDYNNASHMNTLKQNLTIKVSSGDWLGWLAPIFGTIGVGMYNNNHKSKY